MAFFLKKFKLTPFFPTRVKYRNPPLHFVDFCDQIRSLIADYAVILTIIVFVAVDNYYGLATPKLIVPTEFKVLLCALKGSRTNMTLTMTLTSYADYNTNNPLFSRPDTMCEAG